jgi:hypothetical protein
MSDELNFDVTVKTSEIQKETGISFARYKKQKTNKGIEKMETDKKTCSQLVYEKMQERNQMLDELDTIINDTESTKEQIEEAIQEIRELSLGEDSYKVVKIHLSTGGPADWIEVWMDLYHNHFCYMNYHYSDWFDHAETKIEENSYLWDYAVNYLNAY